MENQPPLDGFESVEVPKPRSKFKTWLRAKPYRIYLLVGAAILALGGIGYGVYALIELNKPAPRVVETKPKPIEKPKPVEKFYSPLSGVEVADQAATAKPVTAVMIENSPAARPQSGLYEADLVYEAIAEAGITRFMALYQQSKPELVGPVRSLRMYFVDWLAAYDASIAHVGGSLYALREIRNGSYRDIDQFYNAGSYWRASDRYAPHNVYTDFERLDALNQTKGYTSSTFTGFPRTDNPTAGEPAAAIDLQISSRLYNVHYSYDDSKNLYLRSEGGEPHLDREKGQITPRVVVALKVDEKTVMEDGYREQIGTVGSGQAYVFQSGKVIEATWQKDSRSAPLRLLDASGSEIALARGQTWITAVPNAYGAVSWQ